MSTDTSRVDSSQPIVAQAKVNTLSIVSIVLVGAAFMGIVVRAWSWGPIFAGFTVLTIPAVGAGQVALLQIKARRERGAILAYVALVICYLFATYALLSSLYYGVVSMHQLSPGG
jgi:hypothetical protein